MKIVCLSDTHMAHRKVNVPDGHILIHAGDFSRNGTASEIAEIDHWLGGLPHPHKIIIAGNHEAKLQQNPALRKGFRHAIYLEDDLIEIQGLRIWGSPWSALFRNGAFMAPEADLDGIYSRIPENIDILVTHGPAFGVLDTTLYRGKPKHVGSRALADHLQRIRPKLHVCGHVHQGYGQTLVAVPADTPGARQHVQAINACVINKQRQPQAEPISTVLDSHPFLSTAPPFDPIQHGFDQVYRPQGAR